MGAASGPLSLDPPLVFLHLPKTAGTTFNRILLRHVASDRVHAFRGEDLPAQWEAFRRLPEDRRHAVDLLRGHQRFGMHEHLRPGARYLTIVRDPVDRIVSHYRYVVRTEHPLFIDRVRERGLDLRGYATSDLSGELADGQVRWLAGIEHDEPLGPDDLERALDNVERHFAWVGVTEHLDEGLVELAAAMRWWRVHYRSRNVAATRPDVPADVVAAIEERNPLDRELHRRMVARLRDRPAPVRLLRRVAAAGLSGVGALAGRVRP